MQPEKEMFMPRLLARGGGDRKEMGRCTSWDPLHDHSQTPAEENQMPSRSKKKRNHLRYATDWQTGKE
ncbi:hypothetical protein E2C01_102359 [Portunus trituberculatus]|uniref:Uncharacterized protein n=1 Tax=Portunus trituberculatus TaxID=210409 RepID=A0A5B7KI65_PORTR|nr:hypothetical protein [Portunus trituberculatus]